MELLLHPSHHDDLLSNIRWLSLAVTPSGGAMNLPSLQLIYLLLSFLETVAHSSSDFSDVCNGHGLPDSRDPSQCLCEGPYTGRLCDTCKQGFYGDPRNGAPCMLGCEQGSRFLTNFTQAGVGVVASLPSGQHPTPTFCWWFIAPSLSSPLTSQDLQSLFLPHQDHNQLRNQQSEPTSPLFNFTLQFTSNYTNQDTSCCSERVQVYNGIPKYILSSNYDFTNNSRSESTSCNGESNSVPNSGKLLAAYGGMELGCSSLSVSSSLLTVVYYYSSSFSPLTSAGSGARGFEAVVAAHRQGEELLQEMGIMEGSGLLEAVLPCQCVTVSHDLAASTPNKSCDTPPASCDPASDLCTSPLVPSISSALNLEAAPTNHTLSCSSRIHHSAVYDENSNAVYLFGGLDFSGVVCQSEVVKINMEPLDSEAEDTEGLLTPVGSGMLSDDGGVVKIVGGGGDDGPCGRYLHTASLLQGSDGADSSMLILGGLLSGREVSDELLQFYIPSQQWIQLTSSPTPVAGHTATLTEGGVVIVVGGVTRDLFPRMGVMAYDLQRDSWEVWHANTLPHFSAYGHSAVYDPEMQSVLVYGGVQYGSSSYYSTPSLYALHLPTRTWSVVRLHSQGTPVVFASLLMMGRGLIVTGGLATGRVGAGSGGCGFSGACPNSLWTFINLNSSDSYGLNSFSFHVSPPFLSGWGHSVVATSHAQLVTIGGVSRGVATDSVSILRHLDDNLCTLAQDISQCRTISECRACVSVSNHTSPLLLTCYSTDSQSTRNIYEKCSLIGGEILESEESLHEDCELNLSCQDCLLSGVSECTWCDCLPSSGCVHSDSECQCAQSISGRAQIGLCPSYDRCSGHSTCTRCQEDGCSWSEVDTLDSLSTFDMSAVSSNDTSTVWGCHAPRTSDHAPIKTCPTPCSLWTSCSDCVEAFSPLEGRKNCVWSTGTKKCFSTSQYPLLCSTGSCGPLALSNETCPMRCSDHTTCTKCLSVPECVWTQVKGQLGACIDIVNSPLSDPNSADSALLDGVHYLECPGCGQCSGSHGRCVLETLECECQFGFVGVSCDVECDCNGHSDCVGVTREERETCTQCLHNTQGRSCSECQPFFVGSALNGGSCVPCLEFCSGNSELCMSEEDRRRTGGTTDRNRLMMELTVGPSASEAVCVGCAEGSNGSRCHDCLHSYYDSDSSGMRVQCEQCPCNGHSDGCDTETGLCSCKNNTFSASERSNQCSSCTNGYVGAPLNNSQCYRQELLNSPTNLTLLSQRTLFLAVGKDVSSSSDILMTFVIGYGNLDIYVSTDSMAVQVIETGRGSLAPHRIVIPDRITVISKLQEDVNILSTRSLRDEFAGDLLDQMSTDDRTSETPRFKREILPPNPTENVNGTLFHYQVDDRLTLSIPPSRAEFGNVFYYVTIFAKDSTLLYFEYYQLKSGLNFYIFFGLFFSTLVLLSSLLLASWRFVHFVVDQRRAYLARRRRERQANRPLYSVIVHLHDSSGNTRPNAAKDLSPLLSSKELEYQEVDRKLRTKSLLILDGKPTYITKRKGKLKHEVPKDKSGLQGFKRHKKRAVMKIDLSELGVWPVAMQPTADKKASLHSVLVQLPSKSGSHSLSVGSSLVTYTEEEEERRKRGRRDLREGRGGGGEDGIELKSRRSRDYVTLDELADDINDDTDDVDGDGIDTDDIDADRIDTHDETQL